MRKIQLLLLFIALLLTLKTSVNCQTPGEIQFLEDFLISATGFPPDWTYQGIDNACFWTGLKCAEDNSTLTSIDLNGPIGLSGSIPPSINFLNNLSFLRIYHTSLSGSIPAGIGNLTQLEYFDLSYNKLTGAVPSQLAQLPQIVFIRLQNNALTGTIPTFTTLTSWLVELNLSGNQLSCIGDGFGPSPLGICDLSNNPYNCDVFTCNWYSIQEHWTSTCTMPCTQLSFSPVSSQITVFGDVGIPSYATLEFSSTGQLTVTGGCLAISGTLVVNAAKHKLPLGNTSWRLIFASCMEGSFMKLRAANLYSCQAITQLVQSYEGNYLSISFTVEDTCGSTKKLALIVGIVIGGIAFLGLIIAVLLIVPGIRRKIFGYRRV